MTDGRGVPGPRRGSRAVWVAVAAAGAAVAGAGADPPRREGPPDAQAIPADDQTFRPTVLIRKGPAQGSGTVIASVGNETLILTAAHVVRGPGPLRVELHRYNLGRERVEGEGDWPLTIPAEVAAADPSADVAVVRIRGMGALPYVARIAPGDGEPARGTVVTSVGIDGGTHLSSWAAQVVGVVWFEQGGGGAERPFLLTSRAPEHGRSGGGLFLASGELVGVCMGRTKMLREHRTGIFASTASIRQLLRDHDLDAAIVQAQIRRRTEDRHRGPPGPSRADPHHPGPPPSLKPGRPAHIVNFRARDENRSEGDGGFAPRPDLAASARRGGILRRSRAVLGDTTLATTSNPAFSREIFAGYEQVYGSTRSTAMTVQGAIGKTFALLAILSTTAIWSWNATGTGELQPIVFPAAAIGGFILALITIFRPSVAPWTAPVYAAFEGVFLGALSFLIEHQLGNKYPGIAIQAVSMTAGTLFVMLFVYGTGLIRVTERLKAGIVAATGAICLVYLISLVISLFGMQVPFIHDATPLGIGFSLFVVGLAAFNLLLDFDFIEQAARAGAPKYMEWYGAFGLMVTLVWLYLEILRLLRKVNDRR